VVYSFLLKRSLVSFAKFIPSDFTDFEAVVNGIVFLISFSACVCIVGIQKSYQFLYVNLLSCYLAKKVHD
jgi:hypothetical protein